MAGHANTGAQAISQLDRASVAAPDSIQVTVVGPNKVSATFTGAITYGGPQYNAVFYTLNGFTAETAPTQGTSSSAATRTSARGRPRTRRSAWASGTT